MSETTLKVKTQADIAQLREYRRELQAFTATVREAGQAMRDANGMQGGGAGPGMTPPGAGTAAPTPSPTAPPPAPAAPAAPPAGTGAAPAVAPPMAPAPSATAPAGVATTPSAPGGSGAPDWAQNANQRGGQYLTQMGSTAVALGLGASVFGFLLNSGQKYLELSKIISHVNARFREGTVDVLGYAHAMGYTASEGAGLIESMGNVRDSFTKREFLRGTGFARFMGADPSSTLGTLGRLATLRGHDPLSNRELAEIAGRAGASGMGQGRFGEYLDTVRSIAEGQFAATGAYDFRGAMATGNIPNLVWGNGDPRSQGQAGMGLLEGLNATMTGNPAMQTFMMRAIGFGSPGGPSYIEMRKRLEAGVYDSRNVKDLFKAFRARGMSKGAMFRALESVAGGNLKAWQIEGLVNSLGTDEGMAGLESSASGGDVDSYINRVLEGQGSTDYAQLGHGRISKGEHRAVQMESMQMKVGEPVAQGMIDMTDTLVNVAKSLENLVGLDLGTAFTDLTGYVKHISEVVEEGTRKGARARQVLETPARVLTDEQAAKVNDFMSHSPTMAGVMWNAATGLWEEYGTAGGGGQAP